MSKKKKKRNDASPVQREAHVEKHNADAHGSADDGSGKPVRRSILSNPVVSKLLDLYETIAMSLGGGLFAAMIVHWVHLPGIVEWIVGILIMLAVFLSRTIFSNDVGEIVADARAQAETERIKDESEIASGNYEGIPKIIQSMMPLPNEEERRRDAAEAERQRQLLDNLKRKRKRYRKSSATNDASDANNEDSNNSTDDGDNRSEAAETESHS